jgi:hypothetical protein
MLPEALPYHLRVRDHFRQQISVWEFFSAAPTREEQLSAAERQARIQLYTLGNGEFEIAGRIVAAIVDREDSETSYLETARLFQFYTRIYGDRCADEVMVDTADPEYPIRIRALQLWREQGDAAGSAVSRIVEGPRELGRLDIFSQTALRELTRRFVFEFLRPEWIRTPSVTALAYAYFADLSWDEAIVGHDADAGYNADTSDAAVEREKAATSNGADAGKAAGGEAAAALDGSEADAGADSGGEAYRYFSDGVRERLAEGLAGAHGSVRDYFAFVLLDFVLADASLEDRSAARARAFAADLPFADSFGHLYNRKSN